MSTYTCPYCGERGLSTQRWHWCPNGPPITEVLRLEPPRLRDPIANEYISRLTRELEELRRELEEVRALLAQYQRLVVFADSVARARGDECGLCDALSRDDQPYQSDRAADLIAEAERGLIARAREKRSEN